MRIAYLVSRHPVVSQAFLRREVEGLRAAGIDVETMSVRRPLPEDLLTDADRADAESTWYLLPAGPLRLARCHLRALRASPRRYAAALSSALRLPARGLRGRLWRLFYFGEAAVLRDHMRRRGIAHVHAVQFADAAADVAMLAAQLDPGLTWSITVHGPAELLDPERYHLADKLRRARLVVCASEYGRRRLAELPGGDRPIEVIRLGADPDAFRPGDGGAPSGEGPARVLSVGRLVPEKGHATLLEALAILRRSGADVRATIVGEGPERGALEALSSRLRLDGALELAGAVPQERLGSLHAGADVFCLASHAEAVPVALAEAMAAGLAVVSTTAMGIPELVEDGVCGLLVEPGDAGALATAIGRLIADPELRRRLGGAARARVVDDFDSRRSAERLGELLRETAA